MIRMLPHLLQMGHSVVSKPDSDCNIQLCYTRVETKTNLPKVLRLDGVYYDLDTNYQERNRKHKDAHQTCDAIIYQSYFSKQMCERYLGQRRKNSLYDIIYNGAEDSWAVNYEPHNEINIAVSGKWRRHKRLQETIELFLEFLNKVPDSNLLIFGKLHDNKQVNHPRIKYFGMVERDVMKKEYSKADMFIHLSKKDACPNSVVEAIGSGIPVITSNACGGSTEMCQMTNGCIICDGDILDTEPAYYYKDEYNKLSKTLKNNVLSAMITISKDKRRVKLPEQLTSFYMAKKYINLFEMVIEKGKRK